jgi:hypothetical protein
MRKSAFLVLFIVGIIESAAMSSTGGEPTSSSSGSSTSSRQKTRRPHRTSSSSTSSIFTNDSIIASRRQELTLASRKRATCYCFLSFHHSSSKGGRTTTTTARRTNPAGAAPGRAHHHQHDDPTTIGSITVAPPRRQRRRPHVQQFQRHGILYKTSVLTKQEFQMVKNDIASLSLRLVQETSSSVAYHRIGAPLPPDCATVQIFSNPNGSMLKLVNELVRRQGACVEDCSPTTSSSCQRGKNSDKNKKSYVSPSTSGSSNSMKLACHKFVPVEVRVYQQRGAGMEPHYDDVLFSPEQLEVVFTLENTSDCVTRWEEEVSSSSTTSTSGTSTICWKEVETEANSAILLRAGLKGARHAVSPLKNNGKRIILKLVYVDQNAVFLNDDGGGSRSKRGGAGGYVQQFGGSGAMAKTTRTISAAGGGSTRRAVKKRDRKKR